MIKLITKKQKVLNALQQIIDLLDDTNVSISVDKQDEIVDDLRTIRTWIKKQL